MSPLPLARADWLRLARDIITEDFGPQAGPVEIVLRTECGQELRYIFPASVPTGPVPSLSPVEADIVRIVGTGALIGKAIARRLGHPFDSTLKILLRKALHFNGPVQRN